LVIGPVIIKLEILKNRPWLEAESSKLQVQTLTMRNNRKYVGDTNLKLSGFERSLLRRGWKPPLLAVKHLRAVAKLRPLCPGLSAGLTKRPPEQHCHSSNFLKFEARDPLI
jgi:hypothetical protein